MDTWILIVYLIFDFCNAKVVVSHPLTKVKMSPLGRKRGNFEEDDEANQMNQAYPADWSKLESQDPAGQFKKLGFERIVKQLLTIQPMEIELNKWFISDTQYGRVCECLSWSYLWF